MQPAQNNRWPVPKITLDPKLNCNIILLSLSPDERYFLKHEYPTLLSLSSSIFSQYKFLLSLCYSLCYVQPEKDEGWRQALGWSPVRTTKASLLSSVAAASQGHTLSLLLSRFCWFNQSYPSTYPCSTVEDQGERGGGAQAGAAHWRGLTHHPRHGEHYHGSGRSNLGDGTASARLDTAIPWLPLPHHVGLPRRRCLNDDQQRRRPAVAWRW
jgi:hypothetical protein